MAKTTSKTKTVKKPAPKPKAKARAKPKTAAGSKKKTPAATRERTALAAELKSLIPKLDEEGLAFLVKQAQVHLYNMQVDALNKTIVKENARKKVSVVKPARSAGKGFTEVKMSDSGSSYYIIYNNEWIAFAKDEITDIVKIALGSGTDLEIREKLYNWFSRERSDLLYTAAIGDKFDNNLKVLIALLRDNFKLKGR